MLSSQPCFYAFADLLSLHLVTFFMFFYSCVSIGTMQGQGSDLPLYMYSLLANTLSMIVRPGSNVSRIHGECTEMLIQYSEKANGSIK